MNKCSIDEVEKRTSRQNQSLHIIEPKIHSPMRSCMPLRGIAVSAIERSATAREHKKMLLVICRYLYFKIAIITRIFPILEIVINHDIA